MRSLMFACLAAVIVTASASAADLAANPPNIWTQVDSSPTGGRNSPMFFYDATGKYFVLVGGTPTSGKQHFEVEHFNLGVDKWTNAYPPGAPWKTESGPTDAPPFASDGKLLLVEAGGVTRMGMWNSAYGTDSRAHNQWAFAAGTDKLYCCLLNRTNCYDVAARVWSDTKAKPFSQGNFAMVWGSMCYDPVNKEIVSIGGSSDQLGGTPGTWVYAIEKNEWRHIEPVNAALAQLRDKTVALHRRAWAVLSAARNRLFIAETETEAKADLSQSAAGVTRDIDALTAEMTALKADDLQLQTLGQQAGMWLRSAAQRFKENGPKLKEAITAPTLWELAAAAEALDAAAMALTAEPSGRAHSRMAYHAETQKIVLFGGSGLDRCYCDTWVYDCKTRIWQQRFPKSVPSPRAGHVLTYLPKSKQIVLAGGYTINGSFASIPLQLWTYDLTANQWKLLSTAAAAPRDGGPRTEPTGGTDTWAGAADDDDVLVMVDTGTTARSTWAAKIDPNQPSPPEAAQLGVVPGTMSFSVRPAEWEKVAPTPPDTAKVEQFFKTLPANQWTLITPPKGLGIREWSSTAYDSDRQQWLYWAGGHVTYRATDVAHYSVRSNLWSQSYSPDLPLEPNGGFFVKAALSFHDRPQIPVHTYRAYAYDSLSGRMLYLDRIYNVAEREWEPETVTGLQHGGVMGTLLKPTPHGVVAFSVKGLFRFDGSKRAWEKMPGAPKVEKVWCDGHGMVYDSKRDCLWIAPGRDIYRYDFKSGQSEKIDVKVPAVVGGFAFWEEQVYEPGADLVLLMPRFKGAGGTDVNLAFDPEAKNYVALSLPFSDGKDHNFSWNSAMAYDGKLKVVLLHNPITTWALRLDRQSAKTEVADSPPPAPQPK